MGIIASPVLWASALQSTGETRLLDLASLAGTNFISTFPDKCQTALYG